MAAARPVVLVRYRTGVTGETARTVHVVPLPTDGQAGAVGALCGAALMLDEIETVTPGEGMPCTVCLINQTLGTVLAGQPPAGRPDSVGTGLAAGGITYQDWGWPVILHRDQVRLSLHRDVSALAIPIPLGTQVTQILIQVNAWPTPNTPEWCARPTRLTGHPGCGCGCRSWRGAAPPLLLPPFLVRAWVLLSMAMWRWSTGVAHGRAGGSVVVSSQRWVRWYSRVWSGGGRRRVLPRRFHFSVWARLRCDRLAIEHLCGWDHCGWCPR